MRIYTVYDSKAQAHSTPFYSHNNATAIRSFAQAAQDEKTDFHKYAGDYTLLCVGEWDPATGNITPFDTKENLGLALQYLTETN